MKLLLTFLSLLLASQASADVLTQETYLSNHFSDVLKSYDSRGVVRVDIELKDKKVELPGTNFLVNTNTISEFSQKDVKSISVNIFSELENIPKDLEAYINAETKKVGAIGKIKFIKLEKALRDNSLEEAINTSVEKLTTKMGGGENLLYAIAVIPFILLIVGFLMRASMKNAVDMLQGQFQGLTAALQEQGIGTTPEAVASESASSYQAPQGENSTVLEQSMWEVMSEDFYVGLISDCYWCLEDNYAAFVWGKAPVQIKKDLLDGEQVDTTYLKYISSKEPVDKGFGKNSYYLKPWKYDHVSNSDLGALVKEDKRFFQYLSPMRASNIEFTLEEKLECIEKSGISDMKDELFTSKVENLKGSEKRLLDINQEFSFSSFEEEESLIEKDLDLATMKKFPSLGWALKLSDEKIVEIVTSYQAKDFAQALYCAESIQDKILAKIPEKRRELLSSYLQRSTPSKNSVYRQLVERIFKELELSSNGQDSSEEAISA